MNLHNVIVGPVVTEKAERLKGAGRTYTLQVANDATKVDVEKALVKLYGVDVASVRTMRTVSKSRLVGQGREFTKRDSVKKVMVTLDPKSKPLDISVIAA